MVSLKKMKNGYRLKTRDHLGKQRYVYVPGTRATALSEANRIAGEVRAAKPLRRFTVLTIEEVILRWVRSRLTGPRPNDEYATNNAANVVRRYCGIMGWNSTADITPAEVQRMRETIPRSGRAGANIRAVLWWAKDYAEQPVDERTLVGLRPPPEEGRPPRQLPTPERVLSVIKAARAMSENAGWMLHCLATYGWRAITAARANCGDLRDDGLVVKTKGRKGHREQLVPLLPETMAGLTAIAKGQPAKAPMFLDPRSGERWAEHGTTSIPQWARRTLGLNVNDIKFHAVTTLLDVLDPHQARDLTTHKTLTQLYRYARANRERGQQTIARLAASMTKGDQHGATRRHKRKSRSAKSPVNHASPHHAGHR